MWKPGSSPTFDLFKCGQDHPHTSFFYFKHLGLMPSKRFL